MPPVVAKALSNSCANLVPKSISRDLGLLGLVGGVGEGLVEELICFGMISSGRGWISVKEHGGRPRKVP